MGVKNKGGGNKAKKQGRKHVVIPQNKKVRFSEDPAEYYGCCQKMLGGGMFQVLCIDGKQRLGVIRKKFRGRHKSDNRLAIGTWVLVGGRDFESKGDPDKLDKCDLLEVYRDNDKDVLMQREPDKTWKIFASVGFNENNESEDTGNDIIFKHDEENIILSDNDFTVEEQEKSNCFGEDDEIDLDDI